MRGYVIVLAALACSTASARSSIRASFGHGGCRGRGAGLSVARRSSHSRMVLRFGGGSWTGTRGSGCLGSPGYSAAFGGATVYRGWLPYSPSLHGWAGGPGWRGVGPWTCTDAVIFHNAPGGTVFGHGRRLAEACGGMRAAPGAASADLASLSAGVLVDRGDDAFVRGDFAAAVAAYRAAAGKRPDDPVAALALGHGLFAAGAYAEAAAELRRGIRLYPAMLRVRMNRRDFYGDPAVFDRQLAALERHVSASPGDRAARFVLGYNHFFTQQYGKARATLWPLTGGDVEARALVRECGGDE